MPALKIAVVTGGHHFEVLPFHVLFRALPGLDAYIQHLEDFTSSPQEVRDGYAAVVFYIMPGGAPEERARGIFERLSVTGQGLVMLHHAILAYPDWPVWDEMVGMSGRVVTEYQHDARIPVAVAQPEHPITRGVRPWTMLDETYVLREPGPGSQALLTTDRPDCIRSLAWTRAYRNARVFCYQSGHDHHAYVDSHFRAVLANGIRWAARVE